MEEVNIGKWLLGKPAGTIIDYKHKLTKQVIGRLVVYKDVNGKENRKYFYFHQFSNDKEKTEIEAQKFMKQQSDLAGLTKNMIKYIDKDTIEVDLGHVDKHIMITDAKFIDIIQSYFLRYTNSHVMYQSNKHTGIFSSLISKFSKTTYIDGNILNCRMSNIQNAKVGEELEDTDTINIDAVYSYNCLQNNNYDEYELNRWILGKPSGSIFNRSSGIITIRIKHENTQYERSVNPKKFNTLEEAQLEANKIKFLLSYKANLTTNMIRKISENVIEVKLSNVNKCITTNIFFIPVIQHFIWNDSTNGLISNCVTYVDGITKRYENIIGLTFVQSYKDGNSFNKTLENLCFMQKSTFKIDKQQKNKTILYIPHLNIQNKYDDTYSDDEIKLYAEYLLSFIDYQKESVFDFHIIAENKDYEKTKIYLQHLIDKINLYVNYNYDEFIPLITDSNEKRRMFDGYLQHFTTRIQNYKQKIKLLESMIKKHEYNPMYISQYKTVYIQGKHISFDDKIHINDKNNIIKIPVENKLNKLTNDDIALIDENHKINFTSKNTLDHKNRIDPTRCIKKFRDIVSQKGGESIFNDNEYVSAHTTLKIKCKDNHEFTISLNNLSNGRWCPICSSYTNELLSIKILEHIFEKEFPKIRPDWLKNKEGNNIELDGYNDELKLAVEYNGIQHYAFTPYFHKTDNALDKIQQHDKLKLEECIKNNVKLIVVPYTLSAYEIPKYIYDNTLLLGFNPIKSYTDFNIKTVHALASKNEKVIDIIKEKQGELIDGVYYDSQSSLTIRCKNNHEFKTIPKYIFLGRWCDNCAHIMTEDKKKNISEGMKKYLATEEGQQKQTDSHAKRSETMKQQRDEKRATITEKYCGHCKEIHPADQFGNKSDAKDGKQVYCRKAYSIIKKERKTIIVKGIKNKGDDKIDNEPNADA